MNKAAMRELYHGPPCRRDVAVRSLRRARNSCSLIRAQSLAASVHLFTSLTSSTKSLIPDLCPTGNSP
eukprot:450657-Alexandrium_andersonii.AAC.1